MTNTASTAVTTSSYPSRVTEIDGKLVVADEAAISPLSTPDRPVIFRRIRELLLDDGSTVFRCAQCPETDERLAVIRYHLREHNPAGGGQGAASDAKAKPEKDQTEKSRKTRKKGTAKAGQGPRTTVSGSDRGTVLPDLTLAELATRLHELAELDALRAEAAELRAANARLEAECQELRTGHDELLAAARAMPALVRRAEAADKLLLAVRTAIHDLQASE
jgi:hypothetical protein